MKKSPLTEVRDMTLLKSSSRRPDTARRAPGPKTANAPHSVQDPGLTGITVQILPAIQMLMCAVAPRATNRDAMKWGPVGQPLRRESRNIL